jgi:hypothetical protein
MKNETTDAEFVTIEVDFVLITDEGSYPVTAIVEYRAGNPHIPQKWLTAAAAKRRSAAA